MKIKEIKISDLTHANYNPRIMPTEEMEKLKDSIKEFGFVEPVVVNEDLTIIGGHQRVLAAEQMGMTTVPCFVTTLTKEKEKLLNLALNKISGMWDEGKLSELINSFEDTPIEDLTISGFSVDELESLKSMGNFTPDFEVESINPSDGLTMVKIGDIKGVIGDETYNKFTERFNKIKEEKDLIFEDIFKIVCSLN